jgi:hypothetical protein
MTIVLDLTGDRRGRLKLVRKIQIKKRDIEKKKLEKREKL